jgi:hypothetical protein
LEVTLGWEEKSSACRILFGKPIGKLGLGRLEDNIKLDLMEKKTVRMGDR